MKKVFTLLSLGCALLVGNAATAQSFTMAHDTVWVTASGPGMTEAHSDITNAVSSGLTVQWKVVAHNFPADWVDNTGICDNASCYSGSGLLAPAGFECVYPASSIPGTFKMQIDVSASPTAGPYYIKARVNNKFATNDTANVVFVVTKAAASVGNIKTAADVALYPNPATSSVNLMYDAVADIKNIAIYNIIGKQMNMYRALANNSATINVESLPSGIYFVRLLNGHGDIVATRKFTKQ